jgi:peptidoglycan/LPS O-acetylase OafA/YrhL
MHSGRNTYIDLLRAAAICPVLLVHWKDSGPGQPGSSTADQVYAYLAERGPNGVLLFFVISGFVITSAAMAREPDLFELSYRTFYPRRFARIYPLLIAVCVVGIAMLLYPRADTALRKFVVKSPSQISLFAAFALFPTAD